MSSPQHFGDVHGRVHGNVHGDVHGNVHGKVHGKVHGNVHGNVHGDVHGTVHGNVMGGSTYTQPNPAAQACPFKGGSGGAPRKECPDLEVEMLETGAKLKHHGNLKKVGPGMGQTVYGVGSIDGFDHSAMMVKWDIPLTDIDTDSDKKKVLQEATEWTELFYRETHKEAGRDAAFKKRMAEITAEIGKTGTYTHTFKELEHGGRVAWRNTGRCINRIQWQRLKAIDRRDVETNQEAFEAMEDHTAMCNNNGVLTSTITFFKPKKPNQRAHRIWSPQVARFAYYPEENNGEGIGDKANKKFTEVCLKLGWKSPSPRTEWDVLPLVLQMDTNKPPEFFEMSDEMCAMVPIQTDNRRFNELGLKWPAIPFICDFALSIGGVEYCCCPFSGWFMQSEVARDIADEQRYGKLPQIAKALGLDTSRSTTLWRDEAFLYLNKAILTSFEKSRFSITDHHSASDSFILHYEEEMTERGYCPGDWVWIAPPIGGSTTKVFHQEMINFTIKPYYNFQVKPWAGTKYE